MIGLNGKLDEWHSATALAALDGLADALGRRRAVSATMREVLRASGLRFQANVDRSPTQFLSAIAPTSARRDEILTIASASGVELRTYYSPPLHVSPAYSACDRGDPLAVTVDVARLILSLPMAEDLSDMEQLRIAACCAS